MFGALNRFIGRLDEAPREPRNPTGESTSFGFQVLRNKDPELPLEPWFDFIVGINGHLIVCSTVITILISCQYVMTGRPGPEPLRYRSPQLRRIKCDF